MDFRQKYDLLDAIPGAAKSFRAQQAQSGRPVAVHFLAGGRTPENEALLRRIRALPPASLSLLLEVGDHQGDVFVVIAAPPYQPLADWIADQEKQGGADQLRHPGVWKIPAFSSSESEAAAPPEAVPTAPGAPGEFTRVFQLGSTSAAPASAPPLEPPQPSASSAASSGPGEFTRLFQAPLPPAPDKKDWPAEPPKSPAGAPGEFTRMFQSPVSPPKPTTPAEPSSAPGEFTRMFQSPVSQPKPAPAAEPLSGPGEFTRIFQTPSQPPAPASDFALPPAPPPPKPAPQPAPEGDFTRIFRSQSAPAPPAAPPPESVPLSASSGITQAFSRPPAPAAPSAPQPGPSEYTMLMRTPTAPVPVAPPPPQAPAPVVVAPPPAAAPAQPVARLNLLLLAIVAVASFLLGGLVVFLLLRH